MLARTAVYKPVRSDSGAAKDQYRSSICGVCGLGTSQFNKGCPGRYGVSLSNRIEQCRARKTERTFVPPVAKGPDGTWAAKNMVVRRRERVDMCQE